MRAVSPKKKKTVEAEGKNGLLEPKKVKCSKCGKKFFIKYVIPRQEYSQKNNLGYWSERDENRKEEWCNSCILALFRNKSLYWQVVKSQKRRLQMRKYIYDGKFAD